MLFLALACSGSDTTETDATDATDAPTDATDATDAAPTGDTAPPLPVYEPTWAGMERFFAEQCDACHPSQQGLDLHTGIPEDIATYQYYVKPGEPDQSRLWLSISGPYATMPYQAPLLPAEVIEPVRVWIENGAVIP